MLNRAPAGGKGRTMCICWKRTKIDLTKKIYGPSPIVCSSDSVPGLINSTGKYSLGFDLQNSSAPVRIRIRILILMFLGLLDPHPDPLVTSTDPNP
jgi:hypothetical protein